MSNRRRIGVFGGTFDPIHNTHLAIARSALEQADLDSILFVVSANPPHKRSATGASAEDRFALVDASIADSPHFESSRIELDRSGPSYMADTLDALQKLQSNAALFLIIGKDSLIDLPKWHAPKRILARAHLLVIPRPGEREIPKSLEGHYTFLAFDETEVSSTEIRARIASGDPCEDLLPAPVRRIIQERGLYRECAEHPAGQ